jgi:hypothetical protein
LLASQLSATGERRSVGSGQSLSLTRCPEPRTAAHDAFSGREAGGGGQGQNRITGLRTRQSILSLLLGTQVIQAEPVGSFSSFSVNAESTETQMKSNGHLPFRGPSVGTL